MATGAVFTSLYDSDSYEFIVFSKGRQIDLLMSDVESYSGPLKRLTRKSRATQWARIFGNSLTTQQIDEAAVPQMARRRQLWQDAKRAAAAHHPAVTPARRHSFARQCLS